MDLQGLNYVHHKYFMLLQSSRVETVEWKWKLIMITLRGSKWIIRVLTLINQLRDVNKWDFSVNMLLGIFLVHIFLFFFDSLQCHEYEENDKWLLYKPSFSDQYFHFMFVNATTWCQTLRMNFHNMPLLCHRPVLSKNVVYNILRVDVYGHMQRYIPRHCTLDKRKPCST